MEINIVEAVFDSGINGEISALGVAESARGEGLVGVTKESI